MKKIKNGEKGFTLIELLIVVAIIGILSSIVLVSLRNARMKVRDTKRVSDIRQLRIALNLYYDTYDSYPSTTGYVFQDPSSCNETFEEALSPLVSNGFISKIPVDPINAIIPSGSFCYFYYTNTNCGNTSVTTSQPFAIRFRTEKNKLDYPSWFNQGFPDGGHYCAFPLGSGY
ncbi:MAG: type II secretion system protein [Candidatus Paceibacterota bacterium]|jgi:prepilin-type N-terminal cleavage/methylation domain-containing protein